jgi:glycolate oxidase
MSLANAVVHELERAAGPEAVAVAEGDRAAYATDESSAVPSLPDVVVRPADTAAVSRVLEVANERRVPVVPAGGRTGLSGGSVPLRGGIALSLERLDRIDPVDPDNFTVSVGAGARTADVQAAALAAGLFYPPDPASLSRSTIGGNIASNAGGPRCFKYGVTAEYVLSLEAVAADGRIFRTGRPTRKSTAGLRLAALLVGSEGTLAVVTEATLRLVAAPRARVAATAIFDSVEAAGATVVAIVRAGIVPSALELLDRHCVDLLGLEGDALLLIEVDGPDEGSVAADLERLVPLLGKDPDVARDEADVERLWALRRGLSPALAASTPDFLFEDVCVPVSRIPEALRGIEQIAGRHRLRIPVFCHAGDGNLHPSVLFDRSAGDEAERAGAAEADVLRLALALGGTISAEHGIGLLKLPWLAEELDAVALDQMRAIKWALDPNGILNPGKLLPD